MDDLVKFLTARLAEDWSAARDRELAAGLDGSRGTRDADAKRAIVASLEEDLRHGARTDLTRGGQIALWVTCKRLASIYRDHPDYRQEWKP